MQIFVDLFAFFQTCDRSVLPVYRADIGTCSFQRFMTAHQSLKAKGKPFIENLPELLLVSFGQNSDRGRLRLTTP